MVLEFLGNLFTVCVLGMGISPAEGPFLCEDTIVRAGPVYVGYDVQSGIHH